MFKFNWYNKFGTIPSSYREAMSYEEQILWLCQQIENLKIESGNYNYNMLENKPSINGVTLEGNINASELGLDNYNYLLNKPAINGVTLAGNKSLTDLGIQGKLTAGSGIRIVGNTISATGGGTGGTSDYRDLEHKPSINGITLVGNSSARELKLQDYLEVDRVKDLDINNGKIANIGSYQLNDLLPAQIPEISEVNGSYVSYKVASGTYFDIYGNYDLYKFDDTNALQIIYTTNNEEDGGYFEALSSGTLIINFFNLGNYTPELKEYYSGESINLNFEEISKKTNFVKYDLDTLFANNFPIAEIPVSSSSSYFTNESYFAITKEDIGKQLPTATTDINSCYLKIPKTENFASHFVIKGNSLGVPLWFTTKTNASGEEILSSSDLNIICNDYEIVNIEIPDDASYIYIQFTNVDSIAPKVFVQKITALGGDSVNKITSSITLLADTTPTLTTGLYVLDAGIYIGSVSPSNLVYSLGELIYYDSTSKIFYGTLKSVALESGTWTIYQNENIENTLTNSRDKIPTSQAVYNALQNAGAGFYTTLENSITFNLDGTISDTSGTLTLESGYYLTNSVYYVDANGTNLASPLSNVFCYYNASTNIFSVTGLQKGLHDYNTHLFYIDSTDGWELTNKKFSNIVDTSKIATSLNSSSTDSQVASAKAVYNATLYNYTNTERVVGTWTNGKPLYERTFTTEAPQVTTDGTDATKTIDILNTIEFSFVSFQNANSTLQSFPLPYVISATPPKRMTCRTDRNNLTNMTTLTILSNSTGFNNTTIIATVRYTKTTDTV